MKTQLIALPERAMDLAGKFGGEVMDFVPRAGKWLDAGVKLGAVKTYNWDIPAGTASPSS